MLLRFDVIEEVGRFAALKHKAEQFSSLSLIYARNGYGKSTLCAILRSASEDEPNYIAARRKLDAQKESRVQSTWKDAGTIAFGGGKWNSCPGKIYVFDQEFVQQNLHVGESVTRENKRSLLPVVLGSRGVELARKVIDLDKEQRDLATASAKNSAIIRASCPVVTTADLLAYCQRAVPEEIDQRIEHAERAVQLAKQAVTVQQKTGLRLVEAPALAHLEEIAGRTLTSIAPDLQRKVERHVAKHGLVPNGDRWLKYGTDHLTGDTCPFCDQNVAGNGMVAAFSTYFSAAFAELIQERDSAIAAIDKLLENDAIAKTVDSNIVDVSFWAQVCDLPSSPCLDPEQREEIRAGLDALRSLLNQKVSDPLKCVMLGESRQSITSAFQLLEGYNGTISACQMSIEEAKAEAKEADLFKAERVHSQWLALGRKRAEPVKKAAADYAADEVRRTEVEAEKRMAQTALTTYAKDVMTERQDEINDLLSAFGANFKIADAKANFKGREPNTDYAISIGSSTLVVGDRSETEPSFKTVLSAGDKTTLALAFFLTQLRAEPELGRAVVAFDDPFNSQDMNRQFETTSQVRAIAKLACQTFVFSHDPRFLQMIEKDADASKIRTFQLMCTDKGEGSISSWSSAAELKSLYVRQAEMIREFATQGTPLKDETPQSTLQAIRPFLEDYIKARFPGRFADHELLVPMIEAIRQAGSDDPLHGSVDELLALNEYTRRNMHGGGQSPDPVGLRAQARKVVQLVGSY